MSAAEECNKEYRKSLLKIKLKMRILKLRHIAKANSILGEGHPFHFETMHCKGDIYLVITAGDLVYRTMYMGNSLNVEEPFETILMESARMHAERLRKKELSFVSPQNQLRPFLTPRQELGL